MGMLDHLGEDKSGLILMCYAVEASVLVHHHQRHNPRVNKINSTRIQFLERN